MFGTKMLLSVLLGTACFTVVASSCSNDCATDPSVTNFCYIMGQPCLVQDSFTACDPYGCEMVSLRIQSDYDTFMAYRSCMGVDVFLPYVLVNTMGLWTHYRTGQAIGYVSWATGEPNGNGAATYMETYNGGLDDMYGDLTQVASWSPSWMCICYMCAPSSNPNLIASQSWAIPNTTVSFSCAAGYSLSGATSLQCRAGGIWSGSLPTCASAVAPETSAITTAIPTAIPTSLAASTPGIAASTQPQTTVTPTVLVTQGPTDSSNGSFLWPLVVITVLTFLTLVTGCIFILFLFAKRHKSDKISHNEKSAGTD